jgi:glycosyltransferase involved in cell wall biosynthesis
MKLVRNALRRLILVFLAILTVFLFNICLNSFTWPANIETPLDERIVKENKVRYKCFCDAGNTVSEGCGFLDAYENLYKKPSYGPGQAAPCILMETWTDVKTAPTFSVILTVHNNEKIIEENMNRILLNTQEPWEFIIVLDDCTDRSASIVVDKLEKTIKDCEEAIKREADSRDAKSCLNYDLVHVLVINQRTSVFETTANNIGMRASIGKYFLLIQDDMIVEQLAWNSILAIPFRTWRDVIGVSGRCSHILYSSKLTVGKYAQYVGRCNADFGRAPNISAQDRCTFYIRDTVNRGPLLLRADYTRSLGYLNEEFLLENDDHDFFARAYSKYGYISGVLAIDVYSPLEHGATRQKPMRSPEELEFMRFRRSRGLKDPNLTLYFPVPPSAVGHWEDRMIPTWYCKNKLV